MSCGRCGACCRAIYFRPWMLEVYQDNEMLKQCILYDEMELNGLKYIRGFCIHWHPDHGCLVYNDYRPEVCETFACRDGVSYDDAPAPATAEDAVLWARRVGMGAVLIRSLMADEQKEWFDTVDGLIEEATAAESGLPG